MGVIVRLAARSETCSIPSAMSAERSPLTAPYVLEHTYRRSVGPVLARFLGGLRDGVIFGSKTPSGRVVVPPSEYDPDTGEAAGELVQVGTSGVVATWSWVATPAPKASLSRPHAWALVKLDGADTAILHAVDVASPEAMRSGMRVRVRWRAERTGEIADIACFEPETSS
jgi:uncharacterized OB-fold protein